MSRNIGDVLQWKFQQDGMMTEENTIRTFPAGVDGVNYGADGLPTPADQTKWTSEYDAYVLANAYKSKRAEEYPPIGDQLDSLWKGGDDAAAMKVIIDKVKSDNPKG